MYGGYALAIIAILNIIYDFVMLSQAAAPLIFDIVSKCLLFLFAMLMVDCSKPVLHQLTLMPVAIPNPLGTVKHSTRIAKKEKHLWVIAAIVIGLMIVSQATLYNSIEKSNHKPHPKNNTGNHTYPYNSTDEPILFDFEDQPDSDDVEPVDGGQNKESSKEKKKEKDENEGLALTTVSAVVLCVASVLFLFVFNRFKKNQLIMEQQQSLLSE